MKILIISSYFSPEVKPRAFRTSELALQLANSGHEVEVIYPDKGFACDADFIHKKLKLVPVELGKLRNTIFPPMLASGQIKGSPSNPLRSILKKIIKPIIDKILPGHKDLFVALKLLKVIRHNNKDVDLLISIGLPFSIHLVSYIGITFGYLQAKVAFAEYGDPYSGSPQNKACFYCAQLERVVLRKFNKVIVPVEQAIQAFDRLVVLSKIAVIPQGFRINMKKGEVSSGSRKNFAYAGIFYPDIRNPSLFLDYLCSVKEDFVFRIYTDLTNDISFVLLQPYMAKLGDKLEVHGLLPREQCIVELSRCDFLVNFNNLGGRQVASKLIDYTITGRPILSIQPDVLDFTGFDEFLMCNYANTLKVDISKYDIKRVANQFIDLAKGYL